MTSSFDNQESPAKRAPTPEEMIKRLRQWADELDFPGTKSSNARAALLRAAADALAERGLRPIETAPNTGQEIGLAREPREPGELFWRYGVGYLSSGILWDWNYAGKPTHWFALPSPPPAKEGEKT